LTAPGDVFAVEIGISLQFVLNVAFWLDFMVPSRHWRMALRPGTEPGGHIVVRCQSEQGNWHGHDDHQFPAPLSKRV